MATTVKFFLDDRLVGTQTVNFQTGQPTATVHASQQVTLGGITGELSADWTVDENRDSGSAHEYLDYWIGGKEFHGAEVDGEKSKCHVIEKTWTNGALTEDDEGWYNLYDYFFLPYSLHVYWIDDEHTEEQWRDLQVVDEIELYYTSYKVKYYSDDSLAVLLSSSPIFDGTPYSLAAAPARPAPNLAFAGWMAVADEEEGDEGPGVASPWPWNPGDQIDFDPYPEDYFNEIISDPADLRGGCRRVNLYNAIYGEDEDGHPYIAMYACWHSCTGKLIRDEAGHLMRDDTTGRPLIDL